MAYDRPDPQRERLSRRPDGRRSRADARRLRDEDRHPASPRGEPAAPDRGDGARDAQFHRPAEPWNRGLSRRYSAEARAPRSPTLGFRRWLLRPGLRAALHAALRAGRGHIVAAAREATPKTLYAKLSPATWDIAETARAVADAGADGLSLVNTIRGLALAPTTLEPTLERGAGGYSGPVLRPIALACVYACATAVDLPIVGMGGVSSGRHAVALVAAGASAVALGTVLFAEPFAARRVRVEMTEAAVALGYPSAAALRGKAHKSATFANLSAL
ncbi:MAG: hypothetical protein E6G28_06750 [Actinobacteria bacterium]|nr:MAG: hypothetical protein E6G28_06750 [Actinomycetota bacterium]